MTTTYTKTHKASGWTRTPTGHGLYRIEPTDADRESGEVTRIVAFLSAGSWANYPHDDRARIEQDRVVLVEGDPLPAWAIAWLEGVNARSAERGREALRAAMDDAAWHEDSRDGW